MRQDACARKTPEVRGGRAQTTLRTTVGHGFFNLYGACEDGVLVEPPDEPFDLDPIPALELA
ncbi:MAG: hypothetical protein ACLSVD_03395 [Eggerthellaceae bacterium]